MQTEPLWPELFSIPISNAPTVTLSMRLIRKRGEPLLLVPNDALCAARSLDLYPAQTTVAKLAKMILKSSVRAGFSMGLERVELNIPKTSWLLEILNPLPNATALPRFAVLSGNSKTSGRRYIVLTFDSENRPRDVIKLGVNSTARELINREAAFLRGVPIGTPGIPTLKTILDLREARALVMDFQPGRSPSSDLEKIFSLLSSWVNTTVLCSLQEFSSWQQLKAKSTAQLISMLEQRINRPLHPTIYHGDFAPWNIKSDHDHWTVLDWERGELRGLPGWDCFHFIIQQSILVERCSTPILLRKIDSLLSDAAFVDYAKRANIFGFERELLLAYLLHQLEVIQPTEGKKATQAALDVLSKKWL